MSIVVNLYVEFTVDYWVTSSGWIPCRQWFYSERNISNKSKCSNLRLWSCVMFIWLSHQCRVLPTFLTLQILAHVQMPNSWMISFLKRFVN